MSEAMQALLDRWVEDETFRLRMRDDPEAAATEAGVSLTAEDREALRGFDWSMPDEELEPLITKLFRC